MNLGIEERMRFLRNVPAARVAKFGWMTSEIVATEPARHRLARWVDAGMPDCSADELRGIGDISIQQQARNVLAALPSPVIWYVVHHCTIVAVGRENGGWCDGAARLLGCRIIALPGNVTDDTIQHEFAHAILHGEDDEPRAVLKIGRREKDATALEDFAAAFGGLDVKVAEIRKREASENDRMEDEAIALQRAWHNYTNRIGRR